MKVDRQPLFCEALNACEFFVSTDGFVKTDESWYQTPSYLSHSRVYYVMEGSGVLYSDTERILLEPGYVYLAPCGMKYGFYGTDSVTKLFFHVNLYLTRGGRDAFSNYNHFIRLPRTVEHMDLLKEWYFSRDPYDHFRLKDALMQTLEEALRIVRTSQNEILSSSETVSRALGFIYRNLSAHLTVRDVAECCFCSQSKLSALFRREVGQSVARYIDDLLMSESKNMLLYSEDSIGTISEKLGFCDQFYFSRRFTRQFGISPLKYRKKEKPKA